VTDTRREVDEALELERHQRLTTPLLPAFALELADLFPA